MPQHKTITALHDAIREHGLLDNGGRSSLLDLLSEVDDEMVARYDRIQREEIDMALLRRAMGEQRASHENEMANFKKKIVAAILAEAEDRGWCDEVYDWLERQGLEAFLPSKHFHITMNLTVEAVVEAGTWDDAERIEGCNTEYLRPRIEMTPGDSDDAVDYRVTNVVVQDYTSSRVSRDS